MVAGDAETCRSAGAIAGRGLMLILGHAMTGTVAARWFSEKADLRWVIFFSLLADLVDKPVGLILFRETINNGRVYFHSLLVNLILTLMLVLARKPLVYPLVLWIHQLCDLMWDRPWVALWPWTGTFGYRDLPLDQWVSSALNPYNVTTEALGLMIFIFIVYRYRLYEKPVLRAWLDSGRLPPVEAPTELGPLAPGGRQRQGAREVT